MCIDLGPILGIGQPIASVIVPEPRSARDTDASNKC
jgi:hypothetical protein